MIQTTVEPPLRGHPDKRPPSMERPLGYVNIGKKVLISSPNKRPPLLKGHFSSAKMVASLEGFHCTVLNSHVNTVMYTSTPWVVDYEVKAARCIKGS